MAKLNLSKLNIKKEDCTKTFNFNNEVIEIKTYLPSEEKLNFIADVLTFASEEARFYNVLKMDVFFGINVIKYYTNINLTKSQMQNIAQTYDMLMTSGLLEQLYTEIGEKEIKYLKDSMISTMESIYKYENSIHAILTSLSQEYNNLNLDILDLKEKLTNSADLGFLKDVVDKMG